MLRHDTDLCLKQFGWLVLLGTCPPADNAALPVAFAGLPTDTGWGRRLHEALEGASDLVRPVVGTPVLLCEIGQSSGGALHNKSNGRNAT